MADHNGFKFSSSKTVAIHFQSENKLTRPPKLYLGTHEISFEDHARFLGVTFQKNLKWDIHINTLKAKCLRSLCLLRSICSFKWGADEKTLLLFYRAFVRSKLDYADIIYGSAPLHTLNCLNPVANEALRIATGAFKTSPIRSLEVLANEPPLQLRRDLHLINHFYKMRANLRNSARNISVQQNNTLLYKNKRKIPPIGIRATNAMEKYEIPNEGLVKPLFMYRFLTNPNTPTWQIEPPVIELSLTLYSKTSMLPQQLQAIHARLKEEKFSNLQRFFITQKKT